MRKIDLSGQKFGKLTVLGDTGNRGAAMWTCQCECGNIVDVFGINLTGGRTKSCGCTKKVHGDSLSKLYAAFMRMGRSGEGREWADYATFKDWALSNGYQEGMVFRRIDTELPFGPENCRIEHKN